LLNDFFNDFLAQRTYMKSTIFQYTRNVVSALVRHAAMVPLALTLGLLAPSHAAESSPATPASAAKTSPGSKGLFWEIKSGDKTVYMFGSIHVAKPDFYPLPQAVEAAYKRAEVLAVELDASAPGLQQKLAPYITYAAPDKLQNHLSAATWKRLTDLDSNAAQAMQSVKPGIVVTAISLGLMKGLGYAGESGIDLHFIKQAKADGKRILELETAEFQVQVLTSLSDADSDAMLGHTLDAMKSGELVQMVDAMVNAWRSGDAETLAKIMRESSSKDPGSEKMMKALLDDRNLLMTEKIIQLLQSGKPAFIVVGAGHMAGPKSIVDLLQKKGITVTQIR
jgi:uncharacterized protein